jgi:peptidoglycan/xylan/chitin deacetylase (PgdA/CDA1 family)
MLSNATIVPALPDGRIALTYDDGPGPNSLELARYLNNLGVKATFFVVGRLIRERPDVVLQLKNLGHAVGNHTDTHRVLPGLVNSAGELRREIICAHKEIETWTGQAPDLFRAPGGAWTAAVASVLRDVPELQNYSGPFGWNIEVGDWEIGQPRNLKPGNPIHTLENCRAECLRQIREKRKGVVLLHDWAADPPGPFGDRLRQNNRVLELTKWLVPQIRDFIFVRLDEI